jgi:hypothetical protein
MRSTPATESILSVLPPAKAGVGAAVNDATRVGAGYAAARHAPPKIRVSLIAHVQSAFMTGLHAGCYVAAGVCAIGALGALALPGRPPPRPCWPSHQHSDSYCACWSPELAHRLHRRIASAEARRAAPTIS